MLPNSVVSRYASDRQRRRYNNANAIALATGNTPQNTPNLVSVEAKMFNGGDAVL
jgi:hypothetical protein